MITDMENLKLPNTATDNTLSSGYFGGAV
jgi:hypothetical protein